MVTKLILFYRTLTRQLQLSAKQRWSLTKGAYKAAEHIEPDHFFVAAPVDSGYPMTNGIDVVSLDELIKEIKEVL